MREKGWKTRGLRLLAVVSGLTLVSCAPLVQEPEEEENLMELKIGADILKPFFYKDENGNYTGIDAEIAEEACRLAGYQPVFVELPWGERDEYLKDGRVDCLWTAFAIDGREEQYQWTEAYMESELGVLVDEKSPDRNLKNVHGCGGVAVRAASKSEELLLNGEEYSNLKVYSCSTFPMAQTAFVKGYADGLISHKLVLQEIQDEYPGLYHYLEDDLLTLHLGVAFQKTGSEEICQAVNEAISKMKADGRINEIIREHQARSGEDGEEETNG